MDCPRSENTNVLTHSCQETKTDVGLMFLTTIDYRVHDNGIITDVSYASFANSEHPG